MIGQAIYLVTSWNEHAATTSLVLTPLWLKMTMVPLAQVVNRFQVKRFSHSVGLKHHARW